MRKFIVATAATLTLLAGLQVAHSADTQAAAHAGTTTSPQGGFEWITK